MTPAVQFGSLASDGWARFGYWRLKPPSRSWVEQLWAMFQGLPPLSAVLRATMVARRVVWLEPPPPVMPPPTQSAWLKAIVEWLIVTTLFALMRIAPPRPLDPLFGARPTASLPTKVQFVIVAGVLSRSHSPPPWPTVVFPENVLPRIVRAPFWW